MNEVVPINGMMLKKICRPHTPLYMQISFARKVASLSFLLTQIQSLSPAAVPSHL